MPRVDWWKRNAYLKSLVVQKYRNSSQSSLKQGVFSEFHETRPRIEIDFSKDHQKIVHTLEIAKSKTNKIVALLSQKSLIQFRLDEKQGVQKVTNTVYNSRLIQSNKVTLKKIETKDSPHNKPVISRKVSSLNPRKEGIGPQKFKGFHRNEYWC